MTLFTEIDSEILRNQIFAQFCLPLNNRTIIRDTNAFSDHRIKMHSMFDDQRDQNLKCCCIYM